MKSFPLLTRRKFLQYSMVGLGTFFLSPKFEVVKADLPDFPKASKLGRICTGLEGAHFDLHSKPNSDSDTTGAVVFRDDVIPWYREVVGDTLNHNVINQRWVETEGGYIYADNVQPVKNIDNTPVTEFQNNNSTTGAWVEVTIPYIDFTLDSYPAKSPWLKNTLKPRLYYSQIMWADQVKAGSEGQPIYRLSEKYGTYGDIFWADARAFRLLTADDIKPIHPDVTNKRIVVDVNYQTVSCYEGNDEVYFCRCSSGQDIDENGNVVDEWSTPVGNYPIWRKMMSTHMSAGSTATGYDTPGIGWNCFFTPSGAAIHSTFWHNGFGVARSHGCINVLPDDAQWIFNWTVPTVEYVKGDLTISGMDSSTRIQIIQG